jgi:hypothetical protein
MLVWKPIDSAPTGVELELSTYDSEEYNALMFPCRRNGVGWSANRMVPIMPTQQARVTKSAFDDGGLFHLNQARNVA